MSPTTTRRLGIVREARLSRPHPHALAAALKQIKRHKERRPPQLSRNGQWGARTLNTRKDFTTGSDPLARHGARDWRALALTQVVGVVHHGSSTGAA